MATQTQDMRLDKERGWHGYWAGDIRNIALNEVVKRESRLAVTSGVVQLWYQDGIPGFRSQFER